MDFTDGSIIKKVVQFSIPILLGNIFQQFYNIVDIYYIGKGIGVTGFAAIGSASVIYTLYLSFISNCIAGFAVKVGYYFGAKNQEKLSQYIQSTMLLSIIIGLFIMLISLVSLDYCMIKMNITNDIYLMAKKYLIVMFIGIPITSIYNMYAHILRSIGDSKTPILSLIVACLINVLFDYLFVIELGFGIVGAAVATLISQLISIVFCKIYVKRKYPNLFKFNYPPIDIKKKISQLLMGFTMGITSSLVFFGSLVMQGAINTLGTEILASHTLSRKISDMLMQPLSSISVSVTTFVSQNLGCFQYTRVRIGIRKIFLLCCFWVILSNFLIYIFINNIISFFISNPSSIVIENTNNYIKFNTLYYFVLSFLFVMRNYFVGTEAKIIPLMNSFIELIVKVIISLYFVNKIGYSAIIASEPLSWTISSVFLFFSYHIQKLTSNNM